MIVCTSCVGSEECLDRVGVGVGNGFEGFDGNVGEDDEAW